MEPVTVLGLCAAVFTTISFLPQLIRIVKYKETQDISLFMYIIISIGLSLWILYGVFRKDLPVILANGVTLVFCCSILFMKIKYG